MGMFLVLPTHGGIVVNVINIGWTEACTESQCVTFKRATTRCGVEILDILICTRHCKRCTHTILKCLLQQPCSSVSRNASSVESSCDQTTSAARCKLLAGRALIRLLRTSFSRRSQSLSRRGFHHHTAANGRHPFLLVSSSWRSASVQWLYHANALGTLYLVPSGKSASAPAGTYASATKWICCQQSTTLLFRTDQAKTGSAFSLKTRGHACLCVVP